MVCVTKRQPIEVLQEAQKAGERLFGENRVQELVDKWPMFSNEITWHLIGHLQTNKVKYIIDKVAMIHSLDRLPLAEEISKRAEKLGLRVNILVQVNVAKEESKFGLAMEDTIDFISEISNYPGIKVQGLMTMAPFVADPEETRTVFRDLRVLKDKINQQNIPGVMLTELSMGMTNDYKIAVEEGATLVRIGSAIFGERNY